MIPVKNIYYMLAYAFRTLDRGVFQGLSSEEFDGAGDLCAAILARGVESQIKRGLGKAYSEYTETTPSPHGRIDFSESLKGGSLMRRQLVCSYDKLTADTPANRIVKSAISALLTTSDVSQKQKRALRKSLPYLSEVRDISLKDTEWPTRLGRNGQIYRVLLFVSELVRDGLLMAEGDEGRVPGYLDDQAMSKLYERFILEYYRKEHPELSAAAEQVPWALDDLQSDLLPKMQTDITLRRGNETLIIDAKYYARMTQEHFDNRTLHSQNLYQIFTYVKNMQEISPQGAAPVSGMLLYARTDEDTLIDSDFRMSGNRISARSLDLNRDFKGIRKQLDEIVDAFLP